MNAILTIFWGLVVLIFLVLVHELGHFIAARSFKVRVTEFMIGMPGPNISFERNGCRYGITCIPLGGYNRITGMEPGRENPHLKEVLEYVYRQGKTDVEHTALACNLEENEAYEALVILDGWGSIQAHKQKDGKKFYYAQKTSEYKLGQARLVDDAQSVLDEERKHTYRGLNFWRRLVVLFAGPAANIITALLIFVILFSGIGISYATNTVDSTIKGSPAANCLEPGDVIVAVDGKKVEQLSDMSAILSQTKEGETLKITLQRDGKEKTVSITPQKDETGALKLGFYAQTSKHKLTVGESLKASWVYTVATVKAYIDLFNPSTMAETISQSSSVVGISVMAKQAASAGAFNLFYLLAVISLSLAIVNLLPIPPLDGGKILVEVIQVVARREVPAKVINGISTAATILLLLLFVFLLRQDILNFILN